MSQLTLPQDQALFGLFRLFICFRLIMMNIAPRLHALTIRSSHFPEFRGFR